MSSILTTVTINDEGIYRTLDRGITTNWLQKERKISALLTNGGIIGPYIMGPPGPIRGPGPIPGLII